MKRPRPVHVASSLHLLVALLANLFYPIWSLSMTHRYRRTTHSFMSSTTILRSTNSNHQTSDSVLESNATTNSAWDDAETIDIDSVSEAEALLACRAYLQRKNRLGEWYQGQARKQMRQAAKRQVLGINENGSELPAFEPLPTTTKETAVARPGKDQSPAVGASETSPFDGFQITWNGGPSGSRLRRSQAAKLKWTNPEFRAKWYAQRWGGRIPKKRSNKDKILEERVRALKPESFLANPLVSAMTEEEIAEAIRMYIVSRRKISVARTNMAKSRREETVKTETLTADQPTQAPLLVSTPEAMAKKRQERAEQAKLRYQKRLSNQGTKATDIATNSHKPKAKKTLLQVQRPGGSTPRDAMARINADLESGNRPAASDVELVLQAQRLSNRRQLLIRILRECFGLRGKCVPADVTNPSSALTFVTSTPIELVGALVLQKLRESE